MELSGSRANVPISVTLRLMMLGPRSRQRIIEEQERVFLRRLQEESGAEAVLSGGVWPERNITLSGNITVIFKAIVIVINKFQENITKALAHSFSSQSVVTLQLVVPASKCSELLWDSGFMIRDIGWRTGTQVHLTGDPLPFNTQLSITLAGQPNCVTNCMKQICRTLLEMVVRPPEELDQAFAWSTSDPDHHRCGQEQGAESSIYEEGQDHSDNSTYARCQPHTNDFIYTRGQHDSDNVRNQHHADDFMYYRSNPQVNSPICPRDQHLASGLTYARVHPKTGDSIYTRNHSQADCSTYARGRSYFKDSTSTEGHLYTQNSTNIESHLFTHDSTNIEDHFYTQESINTGFYPYTEDFDYTRNHPYTEDITYTSGHLCSEHFNYNESHSHDEGSTYTGVEQHIEDSIFTKDSTYFEDSIYTEDHPYIGDYPDTGCYPHFEGYHQAADYPHSSPYLPEQSFYRRGTPTLSRFFKLMEQPPFTRMWTWSRPYRMDGSEYYMEVTYEIMIPNSLIGSVIGLNGANITEIRRTSGARIIISPLMGRGGMRLVSITGSPLTVRLAYYMVTSNLINERI